MSDVSLNFVVQSVRRCLDMRPDSFGDLEPFLHHGRGGVKRLRSDAPEVLFPRRGGQFRHCQRGLALYHGRPSEGAGKGATGPKKGG